MNRFNGLDLSANRSHTAVASNGTNSHVAPEYREQRRMLIIPWTWFRGRVWRMESEEDQRQAWTRDVMFASTPRCECTTPLGLEVVPEV